MRLRTTAALVVLTLGLPSGLMAESAEDEIRNRTARFCASMEKGDLSIIDEMFDLSPGNVFYDINEGPLTPERLKRVWTAATTNYDIQRFVFTDMTVQVDGDRALQTGSWEQTQAAKSGAIREITAAPRFSGDTPTAAGWSITIMLR